MSKVTILTKPNRIVIASKGVQGPPGPGISDAPDDGGAYIRVNGQWVQLYAPLTLAGDLPDGTVGEPYTATLAASGGLPPYTLGDVLLPPGLDATLSDATVTVAGTPSEEWDSEAHIDLSDSLGSAIRSVFDVGVGGVFTPIEASGGTVSDVVYGGKTYRVHTFSTSGDFTVSDAGSSGLVEVLVVGGGGGGGLQTASGGSGGGGGGGAVVYTTATVSPGTFPVVIGSGGAGATVSGLGATGGESSFLSYYAPGGGGGAGNNNQVGGAGASGGGGAYSTTNGATPSGGAASAGYAGGRGYGSSSSSERNSGGGGGAGGAGSDASAVSAGDGGAGFASSISGVPLHYAAGGGGGAQSTVGSPGSGGSGAGGNGGRQGLNPGSGVRGSGGGGSGGGGSGGAGTAGGAGGDGCVVVRYVLSNSTPPPEPTPEFTVESDEMVSPAIQFSTTIYGAVPDGGGSRPSKLITNDSLTHPKVLHIPGGWNGYEYWLAATPYFGSSYGSESENPHIFASNDGVNFVEPGESPIDFAQGEFSVMQFWSDTHLVLDDDGVMHCIYRGVSFPGGPRNYYKSSADGVSWTAERTLFGSSLSTVSPVVVRNRDGGFVYYEVALSGLGGPFPDGLRQVSRRESDDPLSFPSRSNADSCTFSSRPWPENKDFWHIDVEVVGDYYVALLNIRDRNSVGTIDLYLAYSRDGKAFDVIQEPVGIGYYRSCIVPRASSSGELNMTIYKAATVTGVISVHDVVLTTTA